tara:strand:- start:312 stop:1658 length:1347 start_codon:yes stop_codon:yes gene_type:complete
MPINIQNTPHDYYYQRNNDPDADLLPSDNYQLRSLKTIIDQFIVAYVGEEKLIPKAKRIDVSFHAQRAMAELSFDTFKSWKAMEFVLPSSLSMFVPNDYVNYTKISWVDDSGIKHPIYPTSKTSNPKKYFQNDDGEFIIKAKATLNSTLAYIVLDKEYLNVTKGMIINAYGDYIPGGTTVSRIDYSGGQATVYLSLGGVPTFPTYDGTVTVEFKKDSNQLAKHFDSQLLKTGAAFTSGEQKVTLSSASGIEIGMKVSNEYFPSSTTVLDVNGNILTLSSSASSTVASDDMTFISNRSTSTTSSNYKSTTPSENNNDDYEDDTYWPNEGERYGLDPQHAQANGSFYIDQTTGKIHFSSNMAGKTIVLDYLSDSLGSSKELYVHKFAEEAMYKHILYAILSTRVNIPENIIRRFKREKFAETRKAKLRLSSIKLEELTQVLRGKSKQIKH